MQRSDLLEPGQAEFARLVAGLLSHIALVAFGAAVLVIVTAHSLQRSKPEQLVNTNRGTLNISYS